MKFVRRSGDVAIIIQMLKNQKCSNGNSLNLNDMTKDAWNWQSKNPMVINK